MILLAMTLVVDPLARGLPSFGILGTF